MGAVLALLLASTVHAGFLNPTKCTADNTPTIRDVVEDCGKDKKEIHLVGAFANYGAGTVMTCAYWADGACTWHGCYAPAHFDGPNVVCAAPDWTKLPAGVTQVKVSVSIRPQGSPQYNVCTSHLGASNSGRVGAYGLLKVACDDSFSNCSTNRFRLPNGQCVKTLRCKGGKYEETGEECHCRTDTHAHGVCHTCVHTGGPSDVDRSRCIRCGSSTYHVSATKTCVSKEVCQKMNMIPAGSSVKGRLCVQEPLRCRKGKVASPEKKGSECSCGADEDSSDRKHCADCTWNADGSTTCTMCTNHMYLFKATCLAADDCPAGTTRFGIAKAKRECRQPFKCAAKKDADGEPCGKCPDKKYCKTCAWEADNKPGVARCLKCRKGRVLDPASGACVVAEP
jgi:hypothetical protein